MNKKPRDNIEWFVFSSINDRNYYKIIISTNYMCPARSVRTVSGWETRQIARKWNQEYHVRMRWSVFFVPVENRPPKSSIWVLILRVLFIINQSAMWKNERFLYMYSKTSLSKHRSIMITLLIRTLLKSPKNVFLLFM